MTYGNCLQENLYKAATACRKDNRLQRATVAKADRAGRIARAGIDETKRKVNDGNLLLKGESHE
jgi:hypothetical protein